MDLISSKAALCENIMEDPVHHSSPQNEPADHQSSSQNVNHSSPQNEPISNSRNMIRTARRHLSPKQTSGVFCRICHEGDFMESLLSPWSLQLLWIGESTDDWQDKVSFPHQVGVVHRSCLEKWLSSSQYDTCELCRWDQYSWSSIFDIVSPGNRWQSRGDIDQCCNGFVREKIVGMIKGTW